MVETLCGRRRVTRAYAGSRRRHIAMLLSSWLVACSPALDWREMQPDETGLLAQFPCKPGSQSRDLRLPGLERRMTLRSCGAAEHVFALSWIDVAEPVQVEPALESLAAAARSNVASEGPVRALTLAVQGATPQARAGRWHAAGRRPDGRAVEQQSAVFARGLRVYQASVVGTSIDPAVADHFYASLRWAR